MSEYKSNKTSNGIIASYSAADTGLTALELLITIYLYKYYIEIVGLKVFLAGLAIGLAVIWDSISDPIMGYISDRTEHSMGKRRVYILYGGFLLALSFPFLFLLPTLETQLSKFLYLFFMYVIVNTCSTIISVPHTIMASEFRGVEKTKVFGIKLAFINLGFLLGTILPGIYLKIADQSSYLTYAALSISAILIITSLVTLAGTKQVEGVKLEKAKTKFSFQFLKDRPFVLIFVAFFIASFARAINSNTALFYYQSSLGLSQEEVIFYVLATFILVITISIPVWVYIGSRYNKKWPAFWAIFALGLGGSIAYPMFEKQSLVGPTIAAVAGGFLVASIILFDSALTDYVNAKKDKSLHGVYFGIWKMGTKVSRALGFVLTSVMLSYIEFKEGVKVQSPQTAEGLRYIFGPTVGSFFILATLVFILIPNQLFDSKHNSKRNTN